MELLIKLLAVEIWFCTTAIIYVIQTSHKRHTTYKDDMTAIVSYGVATVVYGIILWIR